MASRMDPDVVNGGKEAYELFAGNVMDSNSTAEGMKLFFNTALRRLGLVHQLDEPVVSCNASAKFCFVAFRSSLDCTRALNINGIPYKGSFLKIGRPAKYAGPTATCFTWQDLVPTPNGNGGGGNGRRDGDRDRDRDFRDRDVREDQAVAAVQPLGLTRPYREIFVGNTIPGMSEALLIDYIGAAMQKLGMAHSRSNPVYSVQLTGKFAFLEMRTSVDAANLLNLNGIPLMGMRLKLMRPTKYDGAMGVEGYYTWEELHSKWARTHELKLMTAGQPSRVLVLSNMAPPSALADADLYLSLLEETRYECGLHGQVRSVIVPRASAGGGGGSVLGSVFVEMATVEDAVRTLLALKGRSYDSRTVDIKFYPEEKFLATHYAHEAAPMVITASFGATSLDKVFNRNALARIEKEREVVM
mmetsp:Transcript_34490/g.74555  ORF Transcript_34490/g.74555 Transcript_34490/m.74555 type:complete len:415 (-) Transcript_34490:48-1292(-)